MLARHDAFGWFGYTAGLLPPKQPGGPPDGGLRVAIWKQSGSLGLVRRRTIFAILRVALYSFSVGCEARGYTMATYSIGGAGRTERDAQQLADS
jgi:hypothetical protein